MQFRFVKARFILPVTIAFFVGVSRARNANIESQASGEVMKIFRFLMICMSLTPSVFAQLTARNPVDELKDQVTQALTEANVPFTPDQEKQFALVIEEER